ncbi:DnaJ domain-containing protein [Cupriavidus sp. CP313]
MTRVHTHYDNLKVSRNAPPDVIKAAYRVLSQRYHPDKNSSPDATRIMKILNEAYAILGDPEARRRYDEKIAQEQIDSTSEARANSDRKASTDSDREAPTPNDQSSTPRYAAHPSAPHGVSSKWIFLSLGGLLCAAFLLRSLDRSSNADASQHPAPSTVAPSSSGLYARNVDRSSNADVSQYSAPSIVAPSSSGLDALPTRKVPNITSFDCDKARSSSEKLICDDADLAAMDRDLATTFAHAKAAAPDKRTFTEIARQNWNWRNKNCTDKACLVTWYDYQQRWLLEISDSPSQTIVNHQVPAVQAAQSIQATPTAQATHTPQTVQAPQAAQVDTKVDTVPMNGIYFPVKRQNREECLKTAAATLEGVAACQ